MSIIKVSQKPRRVKSEFETTPQQRTTRVEAFKKHFTQDEYDHLLKIVRLVVPEYMCDPTEAYSEGLLAAARMYDGSVCLSTYVSKCAWNYAIRAWQKAKRRILIDDLATAEHQDDDNTYSEETLGADALPYVEAIDDQFIARINEILIAMANYRLRHARPKVIELAADIVDMLRINANLGQGIGVDEYDNAPLKAPAWKNESLVHRNTIEPRAHIRDHIAQMLNASTANTTYAMIALRKSTRQAMHEGWLPV